MGLNKNFALGIILGSLLVGCASFNYRYYGLEATSYEGKLLGPKPENDIPFAACMPDATTTGKCVVMVSDEFFKMKQDYNETKQRLIECQGGSK